jgi:hypothetical protein
VSRNFGTKFKEQKLVQIELSLDHWKCLEKQDTFMPNLIEKTRIYRSYGHLKDWESNCQIDFLPFIQPFEGSNQI